MPRFLLHAFLLALAAILPAAARADEEKPAAAHAIIPGFERFHAEPDADPVRGGRLLLNELGCKSCHRDDTGSLPGKQAPVLDSVGSRVKRAYLRKFLADPQATKPGTAMPALFSHLPAADKEEQVEALVHFLASTAVPAREDSDAKVTAAGRELYHKIGCVACHGTRDLAGAADKITASTVPLGDLRSKYTLGGLKAFLEAPHGVRPSGRMPGLLDGKQAHEVANYLLPGIRTAEAKFALALPGVRYSYYEEAVENVPDFDKLKPRSQGTVAGFVFGMQKRIQNIAIKYDGFLHIPADGEYKFLLTSDDGSKLWIDGKVVVDNDGVHLVKEAVGSARLARGVHKLVLGYFNADKEGRLGIQVEGPGLSRRGLATLMSTEPQPGAVQPAEAPGEDSFTVRPELAAKGRGLFASVGCANCHRLVTDGKAIEPGVTAAPLAKLMPTGGCLAADRPKGVPAYALDAAQKHALAAAIRTPTIKSSPAEAIVTTMTTFNCYACHQRGKVGGLEATLNPAFTTAQPEMGDEARVPPPLDGVGAKLKPAYLQKILDKGAHDRPYMHTHMPAFGDANVGQLVKLLADEDHIAPVAAVAFNQPASKVKAAARHMAGAQALGCIRCHTFAGTKAEGVQGIDMTLMPERLQHDWFHRYLLDPSKFRPGTRMPASWPDGQSLLPKVLDGKAATQIEALWVYLGDGPRAMAPGAPNKQSLVLQPEDEPIIYRNFIQGAGTRAIGVGYPERINLAFDANDLRLALLWQGPFIDASRHWNGRGEGAQPPLSKQVLRLPAGPSFATLASADTAWPTVPTRQLEGYAFRGYRLSPEGRPTFLYSVASVNVEDTPDARAEEAGTLTRTLALASSQPVDNLWFRAAAGDKIEPLGDKRYRVTTSSGTYTLTLETDAAPRARPVGNLTELLVPIALQGNRGRLVQKMAWEVK